MPNILIAKIDVRKLDKTRFFEGKADASGHKPLYADIVLIPRKEKGRYNETHIVKQSKKKDENVEMPIIGSAEERGGSAAPAPAPQRQPSANTPPPPPPPFTGGAGGGIDDDIPFAPEIM